MQETAKTRAKFGWPPVIVLASLLQRRRSPESGERRRCSNEAKTRNPLKFAGVPQTTEPISDFFIFQQDNDQAHRVRETISFLVCNLANC